MTDQLLHPAVLHTPHDTTGSGRRPGLISWAWLLVFLFLVGFWTSVAVLLDAAVG
jgi:hypothetical protein